MWREKSDAEILFFFSFFFRDELFVLLELFDE